MSRLNISPSRIGTSSPSFSLRNFSEFFEIVRKDFELWEIVAEGEHHASRIIGTAKELLASHPLRVQIHAPLSDINIGSVNHRLREASVEEVKGALYLASKLGAETVTFHPGHLSPLSILKPEMVYPLTRESVIEIDRAAEGYGVRACIENTPNFLFTRFQTPEELISAIEDTSIGITFDIGHANTRGNIEDFFRPEVVERMGNVHLHDNHGERDEHLTPGEGNINFPEVIGRLETLGYRGNYILESNNYPSSLDGKVYLQGL